MWVVVVEVGAMVGRTLRSFPLTSKGYPGGGRGGGIPWSLYDVGMDRWIDVIRDSDVLDEESISYVTVLLAGCLLLLFF